MMFSLRRFATVAALGLLGLPAIGQSEPAVPFVGLTRSVEDSGAWGVRLQPCADGHTKALLHSLVHGETLTGTIESKPFAAPEKLSFWTAGHSHQNANFIQLVDTATSKVLRSEAPPANDVAQERSWDLGDIKGRSVALRLVDGDTGDAYAWMAFGRLEPAVAALPATSDNPIPADWTYTTLPVQPGRVISGGVPFNAQPFWNMNREGERFTFNFPPVQAQDLYLLGAVNSLDQANRGWGGGDSTVNFFLGDTIGTLELHYQSGQLDAIPLIYGYTVWWRKPYQTAHAPFDRDSEERRLLGSTLAVANGLDGYKDGAPAYFLRIKLRNEPLAGIVLADNPGKQGHFVLEGVTLGAATKTDTISASSVFATLPGDGPDPALKDWFAAHTIDAAATPYPEAVLQSIQQLAHRLYTYPADLSEKAIAAVKPDVTAENFAGPKVRFTGAPEAALMTNIYYENAQNMIGRVDPDGRVHESEFKSTDYPEFGGWIPEMGPFNTSFYTRIRALMLLSEMGLTDKTEAAINYSDQWQLYYPKSFPDVQLGGKPVPAHASVVCNVPHLYWDLSKSGWPTKQKSKDMGNAETDGHGMLMLTKWRQWNQLGRPVEWVNKHWEAIEATAAFIPWQLDNPELSFSEHGLLYSESEGGMAIESLYANVPCYFGLLSFIEMAKAAGKNEQATQWQAVADRLLKAMNEYFPKQDPKYGDVWDPAKTAGWGYDQGVLAPILFATDFYGYDALQHLPEGWADRTLRSYQMIVREKLKPAWCAPAGLGYGQNYFVQSALLYDRMGDARPLTDWLARFCYAPRLEHPYRSPEGITMAEDGAVWRRWGDLGNLYQMAEAVYSVQTMLGIDDFNATELKLMPRLVWNSMEVSEWPVRVATADGKSSQTVKLAYQLARDTPAAGATTGTLRMTVQTEAPLGHLAVRMGPFASAAQPLTVTVNGQPAPAEPFQSGDARWAWVKMGDGKTQRFEIIASTE